MRLLIRAALLAFAVFTCSSALAQSPRACGQPGDMAERLAAEYREAVTARGVDAAGNLVILYSNPQTGTWTVMVVHPSIGCAVVVASGDGWEALEYVPPRGGLCLVSA